MVWPSCIICTTSSLATRFVPFRLFESKLFGRGAPNVSGRPITGLKAYDVLSLKALRTLFDFKFHSLPFIQGFVAVHLNGGEVHENVFPGLALNKSVALRSIEPLHSSLFLHFPNLVSKIALPLLVRAPGLIDPASARASQDMCRDFPYVAKKGCKVCPCSPLSESKGSTRATNAMTYNSTKAGQSPCRFPPYSRCKMMILLQLAL